MWLKSSHHLWVSKKALNVPGGNHDANSPQNIAILPEVQLKMEKTDSRENSLQEPRGKRQTTDSEQRRWELHIWLGVSQIPWLHIFVWQDEAPVCGRAVEGVCFIALDRESGRNAIK